MKFVHFLFLFTCSLKLQAQDYRIHFLQDGKEIVPIAEHLTLVKKPFQIQVELLKADGVFGNCSWSDSLFRMPLQQALPETELIQWKIAVEPENNTDKDMIVSKSSYFYWFYNPKIDTWHRFDPNPLVEKGRVVGTKSISSLFLSENDNTETSRLDIHDVNQPMYLLFFLMDKKNENAYQRQRFQIDWQY